MITIEQIEKIAYKSVHNMGDIFFEPQAGCGEYQEPQSIAINRVMDAIVEALKQYGNDFTYDIPYRPEDRRELDDGGNP